MIWDARLILLVIIILNFHFQKCCDLNPLLDPVGGSKLEPSLLRRFQTKHLFRFIKFLFQKCRDPNPRLDPVNGSKLEPGLLRHFQLSSQNICFVLLNFSFSKVSRPKSPIRPGRWFRPGARFSPTFLIKRQHLFSGNPMTIYNFKTPIIFTLNMCIYKSFTISYHAFSMQQFISQSIHEI